MILRAISDDPDNDPEIGIIRMETDYADQDI